MAASRARSKKGGNKMLGEVSFKVAAEQWLKNAQSRKRRPMRPSSVPTVRCALDKYLLPRLGELPLSQVHNGTVKHAVAAMQEAGLSPKTVNTYTGIVKTVVSSVVNEETGEPLFMRRWNPTVLDLPVIENQKQPCLEAGEIEKMILKAEPWERTLYILLAASGLRISEALGLKQQNLLNNCRTLDIVGQVDRFGKLTPVTKTRSGIRQVDLHPVVSRILQWHVAKQRRFGSGGLLFPTRAGTPHLPRNLLRTLDRRTKKGFHSFRRYRETWLSEQNCNHDVKIYWMGHRPESMSELYSKLKLKTDMRLAEAERVGTGLDLEKYANHLLTC
jgi:integrase